MAGISAATVVKLRKMSGQGMMDCKKALEEADGDMDKAMEILRKKGLATLAKRAERETKEGLLILVEGPDFFSLATLCCETDFVAKSDDFLAAADAIKQYVRACTTDEDPNSISETAINGRKFSDVITETVSKTGEKMVVADYARFRIPKPGLVGTYVHFNGKVGSMVEIGTSDEKVAASQPIKQAASDIAMHITASKPLALDVQSLDPQVVEREKAIYAAQVTNKPPEIVKRIVEGKMKKFYADYCLTQQPFVKDDTKTVEQVINEAGKAGGGSAAIRRFVRFEVG
ncbi:MAG: translation elongation factor Ts [Sedimentisphaerales bacterium]|nr:translation elongation factor Ts [Sedimentisphaerales bacterium]